MKKVFFMMFLLVAGLSCTCFAQFSMSLGPAFGMNYNFYHGSAVDNTKGTITQQNVKQVASCSLAYVMINPALKFSVPGKKVE